MKSKENLEAQNALIRKTLFMQKWEYLNVELGRFGMVSPQQVAARYVNGLELKDWKKVPLHVYLGQLGQDGWEMCGTLVVESRSIEYLFFKRPKP